MSAAGNAAPHSAVHSLYRWTGLSARDILLIGLALAGIFSFIAVMLASIEQRFHSQAETTLTAFRDSAHLGVKSWANDQLAMTDRMARTLSATAGQAEAKRPLDSNFAIIGAGNRTLAAADTERAIAALGQEHPLAAQPDVLARLWSGQPALSRVMRSATPLSAQGAADVGTRDLMLFAGAPIRNAGGQVMAVLVLRLDPNRYLFPHLKNSRAGDTGETYLFDRDGWLLTPSRFTPALVAQGLLAQGDSAALNIRLTQPPQARRAADASNPASNSTRAGNEAPLNRMAASAIARQSGVDLNDYRDYRGSPVIGAWLWDDELAVGLASEIDSAEAWSAYRLTRQLVTLTGVIGALALIAVAGFLGRRRQRSHDTENRLKALIDSSIDSIIVIDPGGRIESVNPATERMFGYSAKALIGRNVSMLMPEPHRSLHDGYLANHMATGKTSIIGTGREIDACRADGTIFPADLSVTRLSLHTGVRFAGVIRDLSQRKQSDDNLRMMSMVAENTLNGVVTLDSAQRIKWVNPSFTRITGYSAGEAIGKRYVDILGKAGYSLLESSLQSDELRWGKRSEVELVMQTKTGEACWLHVEIMPIKATDGQATECILLQTDITKQWHADIRLRQAKDEAEDASRAKSSFLAAMSHEIRTPLNGVVGTIDLLEHGVMDATQRDLLRTARDSSLALMGIIDDILDFSKIEAGRLELEHAPVLLADLVEGTGDSLQSVALKKNVDLYMYCDPTIPEVMGDSVRLRQIIYNLAGNAIKFCSGRPEKRGVVEIGALLLESDASHVELSLQVRDNGIGMSAEVQKRLFNPFTQAEESTTRRFGGTGLGLVITRRLTELMGGRIDLDSAENQGSTFRVTLRLEQAPRIASDIAPDSAPDNTPAPPLSDLHVMLLTGDLLAAPIVESYLRHAGARLLSANFDNAEFRLSTLRTKCSTDDTLLIVDCMANSARSDDMHARLRDDAAGQRIRFLRIFHGQRRDVRPFGDDGLAVDINAMRRQTLIHALRVLAGRATLAAPVQASSTLPAKAPGIDEARAAGQLILLAEDNETNQKVIRQQLAMLGYAVVIAENGKVALDLWRTDTFALLLTDCHMPEMDGYQLARAIREEEDGTRLPIIAITADALKGTSTLCLDAGMDDYLTKPLQLAPLQAALQRWLAPATASHAPAAAEVASASPAASPDTASPAASPASTPASTPVDPAALAEAIGMDDPAMLAGFYADFLNSSADIIAGLRAAQAVQDWASVGSQAHKLKSAARTIGAHALADCCLTLEMAGKDSDLATLNSALAEFDPLFEDVRQWIGRYEANVGTQGN